MYKVKLADVKNMMKDSMKSTFHIGIYILLFEVFYKGIIYILFRPLLNLISSFFIQAGGYEILINGDIKNFFFSFWGILMVLVLTLLAILIIYYEFTVLLILIDRSKKKKEIKLNLVMKEAVTHTDRVFEKIQVGLGIYMLVLIPILNLGFSSSLLPSLAVPAFIIDELEKWHGGVFLILLGIIVLIYIFAKLFLVLPIMVFSNKDFKDSAKISFRTMKGQGIRISGVIILATLIWGSIGSLPVLLFENSSSVIFQILSLISSIVLLIFTLLASPFILTMSYEIYNFYVEKGAILREEERGKLKLGRIRNGILEFMYKVLEKIDGFIIRHKSKSAILFAFVLAIIIGISFYDVTTSNSFLEEPLIIGHRGTGYGVENTLDTILQSRDYGAQYAEMDILLSKDNIPMVTHDNNLKRLSGKNLKVSDLTAEEIGKITIKKGKEESYIPTLEELARACKGNVKLLVEFKSHGKEEVSILDATMDVLKREGILEETIFQTAENSLLEEFNEKYPDSKIGYVFIGKIGRINSLNIGRVDADFLSVEESLIDKHLIRAGHRNELPIFAWTINKEYKAETLLLSGVDGIITDYPDLMQKVKDEHMEYFK